MKEINRHLADIDKKLLHLNVSLEQADRRNAALELVVSWLLARHPDDEALEFLSGQANELESNPKFEEDVALLDELRESVREWHVQWRGAHTPPQK